MKFIIQIDINIVGRKLLQEHLDRLQLNYVLKNNGEVEINETLSSEKLEELSVGLSNYGIEIIENDKQMLIQKIKDTIIEFVHMDEELSATTTISTYLSDKLNYKYGYLSNLFSSNTYTSIENFTLLQKTERAKHLIINSKLNCSEVAWKLNYSSLAHFSGQFKRVTGLSPTTFQRIIKKMRNAHSEKQDKEELDLETGK